MSRSTFELDPTPGDLAKFGQWLVESGRAPLTVKVYTQNIRLLANEHGGYKARLTNRNLAPKTLHGYAAALRSYATFLENGDLLVAIKKIRLPASRRAKVKVELAKDAWQALIVAIDEDKKLRPEMHAVLLIMALRGLRVGDVLRMRKDEIVRAVKVGKLGYEAKGGARLEYGIAQIREALHELLAIDKPWDRVVDLIAWSSKCEGEKKMHCARTRVLQQLKRVAMSIELDNVHPHRLRRTYATHWLRQLQGDPQAIIKLQAHMGWQSLNTAMGYVDAVNAEELEDLGVALIDGIRPGKKTKDKRR